MNIDKKYVIIKQDYCTYCESGEFFSLSRLGRGLRCNDCKWINGVKVRPKTYTEFSSMGCAYCMSLEDHKDDFADYAKGMCEDCYGELFCCH